MSNKTEIEEPTTAIQNSSVCAFIRGYKATAMWASTHSEKDDDTPINIDEMYPEPAWSEQALKEIKETCEEFIQANTEDLLEYAASIGYASDGSTPYDCAGHDFWLTRNGHGAGFFDRGLDELGKRLTDACNGVGVSNLIVGDDGKLYLE